MRLLDENRLRHCHRAENRAQELRVERGVEE